MRRKIANIKTRGRNERTEYIVPELVKYQGEIVCKNRKAKERAITMTRKRLLADGWGFFGYVIKVDRKKVDEYRA